MAIIANMQLYFVSTPTLQMWRMSTQIKIDQNVSCG